MPKTSRLSMRFSASPMPAKSTFGVDHRRDQPAAIFCMAFAMFSMRQPKEPKIFSCCWKSCIRFIGRRDARGRAAGDETAAALQAQHRAGPGVGADMLEDDVDALLLGQLAHDALEAVLAVVDDVVGAECRRLRHLVGGADGGDDRAAHLLGQLDGRRADAGAAGVDEDRLAGLELRIVEQHVLDGAEGDAA